MKKIVVVLLACMLGLVAQVHGDIVLQKAKTGGQALGLRLGMTSEELDNVYKWHVCFQDGFRAAVIDFHGAVCQIVVSNSEIANNIKIIIFTVTPEQMALARKIFSSSVYLISQIDREWGAVVKIGRASCRERV